METFCSNCGDLESKRLQIKWKHLKKYVFLWDKNNPGLSPDYQMVCCIHIEGLESLCRENGKKLH